jgi:hypothetical protein
MNTDRNDKPNVTIATSKSAPSVAPSTPEDTNPVSVIIKVMQSVKTDTPEAELNKTTISDGNGGRITMDDHTLTKTFK